jgi:hypothetical protein
MNVTNYIYVTTSNPMPVLVQGMDFDTQLHFLNIGMCWGWPMALSLFTVMVIVKAVRPPRFPNAD